MFATSSGSTTVEFALVAVPFIALLGGIIQFAFIIWAGQNLDFMLQRAVRSLLTGSFQNANAGVTNSSTLLTNLKNVMCGSGTSAAATVFTCSNVKLNVSVINSFGSAASANSYDSANKSISASFESYTCATPGQIVVVTAAVALPTFFKLLNPGVVVMADGSYLLQSAAVFRTEPYQTTTGTGC